MCTRSYTIYTAFHQHFGSDATWNQRLFHVCAAAYLRASHVALLAWFVEHTGRKCNVTSKVLAKYRIMADSIWYHPVKYPLQYTIWKTTYFTKTYQEVKDSYDLEQTFPIALLLYLSLFIIRWDMTFVLLGAKEGISHLTLNKLY